jgi:ElaB/YqjD/DUF883 family membrane-anchored ribosome-binding protein
VSNATETLRDTVRETAKEARMAARESSKAAAEAAEEIQSDLEALREDVAQLAERLGLIVTAHGGHAWNRTKANVGDTIADAESRVRQVTDDLDEAINGSLQTRPYTMLALAAGLGFLVGANWRR